MENITEEYFTYFVIHKRTSEDSFNYHIIMDVEETTIEIKKTKKGTHDMSHTFYELPQELNWELLKKETYRTEEVKGIVGFRPEYEFIFYDNENYKHSIGFNMDCDGPVQELIEWLKKEYPNDEVLCKF